MGLPQVSRPLQHLQCLVHVGVFMSMLQLLQIGGRAAV